MQIKRERKLWKFLVAIIPILLLVTTPLQANRILVIGDSWAKPLGNQLRIVLAEQGHPDVPVVTTPYSDGATSLDTPQGFADIESWLNRWPDANFIYLRIGANDWLCCWRPDMIGTQEEADLFASIITHTNNVVDHIFSIRPEARILWSSIDFLRPHPPAWGTPTEQNAGVMKEAGLAEVYVKDKDPRLEYVNLIGELQVTYGFDGVQHSPYDPDHVIPPGDPSLPDPTLPSPWQVFPPDNASHPYSKGYKTLAQALYDGYYSSQLGDQGFHINPGLNDAWFNLATDGQGFLITVFPDRKEVFLAWFTFDTERPPEDVTAILGEPGHRWLTAQGLYDGDTANLTIYVTKGGVFDSAEPAASVELDGDGTLTLEFADCTEGLVSYEITSLGISGKIPIQRITPDNVALCETLANP